jgi:hypothetical protein
MVESIPAVWQRIDERCQTRHSWPGGAVRSVSAMTFLLVLAVLGTIGIIGSIRLVRSDGYGPRPDRNDRTADPRRIL